MTGATERKFNSKGLVLVGDEHGPETARGTLLLLHGGGQTRHSWKASAARLGAKGWNAINLDARGHGDSSWSPTGDYHIDDFVGDLVDIVGQVGDAPVLIGASLGGVTSLIAVGEGLVQARALVLVDITPRMEEEGVKRIGQFMRANMDGFADLQEVADAISAYNPHRERPSSVEGLKRNVRLKPDGRWYWHWDPAFVTAREVDQETRMVDFERLRDAAANVRVPTLLVRGAQSDVVTAGGAEELLDLVPGSRLVVVPGTGHMVAGDDNDVFTTELWAFLDELPT